MLARRLQRHSTPLAARMENPVRVRLDLPPAPGSGAALCRWLRASSRRYHRPTGQPKRHERTRNWIKLGGKVIRANKPGALIFDDAHVAGKSIRDVFTLSISKADHSQLYGALIEFLRPIF